MPPAATAVVTGADNWTPFAALANQPSERNVGGHMPASTAHNNNNAVVSGSGDPPRPMLMDGVFFPCAPNAGRTVTTAITVRTGNGGGGAGSPRQHKLVAPVGLSPRCQEAVGESGERDSQAALSGDAGNGTVETPTLAAIAINTVKPEAHDMDDRPGSRRMSLRRRTSTLCAAGTSGKAQSTTPLSGANTGGDSMWEQEDEELDALLGPDEGATSDEDDDQTPKGGPKRKQVGRPLKYKGDPNAPHLTEEERRRIKRRIANRESARRVRQKRNEYMDDLQSKCTALSQQNARLLSHVAALESQNRTLVAQVGLMRDKYNIKAGENAQLYNALAHAKRLLLQGSACVNRAVPALPPPPPGTSAAPCCLRPSRWLLPSPSLPSPSDWLPRLPPPLQLQGKSGSDELPSNLPPMSSTTLPPLPGTSPLLLPPHLGGSWLGPPMPPVPQQQGEGPTAAQQASEQLTPGNLASLLQSSMLHQSSMSIHAAAAANAAANGGAFPMPAAPSAGGKAADGAEPAPGDRAAGGGGTPPLLPPAGVPTSAADPSLALPFSGGFTSAGMLPLHHGPLGIASSSSLQLQDLIMLDFSLPMGGAPGMQVHNNGMQQAQQHQQAQQQQQGPSPECGSAAGGQGSRPPSPTPFAFLS
ncbi:hypothetical protein N2152v2_011150 [Parachlorella kessleri]